MQLIWNATAATSATALPKSKRTPQDVQVLDLVALLLSCSFADNCLSEPPFATGMYPNAAALEAEGTFLF
jgi:hypothetical protein